jgi:serine/threonine-protein kinase
VWAAHDETLKREVALKILRPERVNSEWLQRFHREARATAELTHINTVRSYD